MPADPLPSDDPVAELPPLVEAFDRDSWKLLARALGIPVLALFLFFITPLDEDNWVLSAGLGIVATLIAVPYALMRIRRIRIAEHPLGEALAVMSLLVSLVVVGFAGSYYSISVETSQIPAIHTRVDALYFTIVTLGTVGYGDIAPTGQEARLLVSFQIMVNLSLIATLIRLLGRVANDSRNAKYAQMVGAPKP